MSEIRSIIDLGNGYVKWTVIATEDERTEVIAKEIVKTKWMRKWKILEVDEVVHSINLVLDSFVKKFWWDFLEDVYVWISHPEMLVKRVREQKRVLDRKIEQDDLNHVSKILDETSFEANYETVKIIPVHWIVDDTIKVKDPLGMEWKRLELVADVFMLPKTFWNSLSEVFEKLEIWIADVIPNILGAAEVCLDLDDKDLGTLLIDIWNNQTTFVVYEEWFPLIHGVIPVWWEEITKDISIWMQVDIKEAEKLKREKWIIIIDGEKTNDETLDIGFLSEIIAARYEQIFNKINEVLIEIGKDGKLPWWAIFVWWWSKMKNIDKLAKETFKFAAFLGKDKVLKLWDFSSNPQFISSIWIYTWSKKYSGKASSSWSLPSLKFDWMKKIVDFIKNLF